MSGESGNVALAFGLTTAAGLATMLGAAAPFFATSANKTVLAAAVGLSAGVMTYVSFVEIFFKSKTAFLALPHSQHASAETAACFFGGVVLVLGIDWLVHRLERAAAGGSPGDDREDKNDDAVNGSSGDLPASYGAVNGSEAQAELVPADEGAGAARPSGAVYVEPSVSFWRHPVRWLQEDWQGYARHPGELDRATRRDNRHLQRAGFVTALAIAIHNFPEGLATFIATLEDSRVGAVLAVAIAIHNIPEGVCVAMPVFHATGSRMKGFLLGTLSGLSEVVGAALAYAVLASVQVDAMYAIMFGIVSGMMVFISIQQLLPTAHKYDPLDRITSYSFIVGMVIMAVSLILFEY